MWSAAGSDLLGIHEIVADLLMLVLLVIAPDTCASRMYQTILYVDIVTGAGEDDSLTNANTQTRLSIPLDWITSMRSRSCSSNTVITCAHVA